MGSKYQKGVYPSKKVRTRAIRSNGGHQGSQAHEQHLGSLRHHNWMTGAWSTVCVPVRLHLSFTSVMQQK